MNLRAVGFLLGCVLLILAGFLLLPGGLALAFGERHEALAFLESTMTSGAFGLALVVWNRGSTLSTEGRTDFFRREGLAVVGLSWVVASAAGALPYVFAGATGPVDAFFEAASGFTTTGATILPATLIDSLADSLHFWRSFTHWLGGFGIVMVFVVLFPAGGRNLFRSEVAGVSREAGDQRVRDSAIGLMRVYVGLTAIETVLLVLTGMGLFDALIHALGTIPTGGFSNKGASVAAFGSWKIELVIVAFMFASGINFGLYDNVVRRDWRRGLRQLVASEEVRLYAAACLAATLLIGVVLWIWGGGNGDPASVLPDYRSFWRSMRDSLFQVVSVQTCTGFATADFDRWPDICRFVLMGLTAVGGCSGSTAGGLKVVRFLIAFRATLLLIRRFARPRAVMTVQIDGAGVEDAALFEILSHVVLWGLVLSAGTMLLTIFGVDLVSSVTAVVTCLSNMGPGLNRVGPATDFGGLPELIKGFLALVMILGRLEFYAVVALLIPGFWRR